MHNWTSPQASRESRSKWTHQQDEGSEEDWHHAPIWGHSCTHKLFPFYPADIATLQILQITTVSQIFESRLSGGIDKTISPDLMTSIKGYPSILDAEIGVASTRQTRTRYNVHILLTIPTFTNAYQLLRLPSLTSKTREKAFQVLYRTIWTNNKAYKSKMINDPDCERCGGIETMEHVLCQCLHYPNSFRSDSARSLQNTWTQSLLSTSEE